MVSKSKGKISNYCSEDIKINRGINVKLKTLDTYNPNVIEINISLFAIPSETLDLEEYEESISSIKRSYSKICGNFVRKNSNLISNKYITDFNFTPANLKRGYNKYVTMSLYVKQNGNLKINKVKNEIRESLKNSIKELSDKIREENFSCYKNKQVKKQYR